MKRKIPSENARECARRGRAEPLTSGAYSSCSFFFHAITAYAILRHNGVELGKMDYVGSLPVKEG